MVSRKRTVIIGTTGLLFAVFAWLAARPSKTEDAHGLEHYIVCVGRIEPVDGEVDICSQMPGTLEKMYVSEGQWVEAGTLLAIVDARREKAQLELAKAKLARVQAGHGAEEIAATAAQRDAAASELAFAQSELERGRRLKEGAVISEDLLESRQQQVESLTKKVMSLQKQFEAMKRGPLPEEIAVARAEVEVAQANYDLHEVRAPSAGMILQLYRHAGDGVLVNYPTPILRMADTRRLRIRIEVSEQDVDRIKTGMKGKFTTFGADAPSGQLVVTTVLPSFAPRRLFDPDSSARVDTRTLQVLCEIISDKSMYSGQRLTARLTPVSR